MATSIKENYLKALFHLHQKDSNISITDLGKMLDVSKPSVNDMVKKLQAVGWINYEKYKPIQLTETGLKEAALVVRKHRLAEMYLAEKMGFRWGEVHQIAEEIEHISSQVFFDRMDELLGYPKHDPHGSPIPDKEGNIIPDHYKTLSKVEPGEKVIIKALRQSSSDLLKYLDLIGLELSSSIIVNHIEPFDNSMNISIDNKPDLTISEKVAECLLVEQNQKEEARINTM